MSLALNREETKGILEMFFSALSCHWNFLGVELAIRAVIAKVPHLVVIFKESQR